MPTIISGCGSYLPKKCISNQQLQEIVPGTDDEWIRTRSGITQRYIAAEDEMPSDMAFVASKKAIKNANLESSDIDLIIVATTSPDLTLPATATRLQSLLGIREVAAFDLQAVCAGFVYAMHVADLMIKSGGYKHALVVGAEKLSAIVDWQDRTTAVLFGDGAGAVVLSNVDSKGGIIASHIKADGELRSILQSTGGPSFNQQIGFITMNGREVFKHAINKMTSSVAEIMEKCDLTVADIDYFIPHQANIRIIDSVAKNLGLQDEKVIKTVQLHANCSAASVPLALDWLLQNKKILKGSKILFSAIGGGMAWGTMLVEW